MEGVLSTPCVLHLGVCHTSVTVGAGPVAGAGQRVSSLQLVLSVYASVRAPSVQFGGAVQCHHWVEGWKTSSPNWLGSQAAKAGAPVHAVCSVRAKAEVHLQSSY